MMSKELARSCQSINHKYTEKKKQIEESFGIGSKNEDDNEIKNDDEIERHQPKKDEPKIQSSHYIDHKA